MVLLLVWDRRSNRAMCCINVLCFLYSSWTCAQETSSSCALCWEHIRDSPCVCIPPWTCPCFSLMIPSSKPGDTTPAMINGCTTWGTGLPSTHLPFRVLLDFENVSGICYCCFWWHCPLIGDNIHISVIGWGHLHEDGGGYSLSGFSAYSEFEISFLVWSAFNGSHDLHVSHGPWGNLQDHVTPQRSR